MSKSRSQSQSLPSTTALKLEDVKHEEIKPEEQDVQLPPETPPEPIKPESSPPPKRESSETSTPAPNNRHKRSGPQLIADLPLAEEEARATFVEITDNHYQYSTLGRVRETLEGMTCDCQYEPGVDDPSDACGHGSDCINRLTQVECLAEDCRCRSYCQNQRFQRKEYARMDIVLTEKKGYGLRAAADIQKDTFIYEYVGEVVSHPSFKKRMREYAEEGIRHFYFMMLQKDEYIDATKRGGIGRFANHSCSPNCYVAKWTVGQHVRMGIFAKRFIHRDEELTFNYNVDRYGHDAQPCYCGELNCVGYLGGKTQTDIAAMDDLYLDALGITEEVEKLGLKGSKKRKSKKLDEDYLPEVKPLVEKDVPKVVQAIRQTQSRKVLLKLLTRIKITDNDAAMRQIMRLRGFSVMNNILADYAKDIEISVAALEVMQKWPLIQRNKVEDSKIRVPVQMCQESENETMKGLATKLLEYWDSLEVAYRIPKRLKANGEEESCDGPTIIVIDPHDDSRPLKKSRREGDDVEFKLASPTARSASCSEPRPVKVMQTPEPAAVYVAAEQRKEIAAVIAAATAAAEAEAARIAAAAAAAATANALPTMSDAEHRKKAKSSRKHQTKEEKEAHKEKRLVKLIGCVVVKCMSRYAKQLDHDQFKKYAKELTHIIAEKEKKSTSYKEGKLDALNDEKTAKIKKFAREYIAKVVRKLEKSKHKPSSSGDAQRGQGNTSPTVNLDAADMHEDSRDVEMTMSVEQAMDLGSDDDAEMDEPDDAQHSSDEVDPSPVEGVSERPPESVTPMTPPDSAQPLDPRIRHRTDELGWDLKVTSLKEINGIRV
ncbi:hypothetical protein EDC04DRAFT_837620 [Pisolithus marmoratus]|nr:hypothetical protein EDC04DRAFT_837620 [Pisolithus marmoratus]